jgi:hypothetical protein
MTARAWDWVNNFKVQMAVTASYSEVGWHDPF